MGNTGSTSNNNNTNTNTNTNGKAKSTTTTTVKCYYELLGVAQDATPDEIKKGYRQKALLLHPDKNMHRKEDAHAEFSAVQAAYEVLNDPQERAWYDRHRTSILNASSRRDADDAPTLDDLLKYFNESCYQGYDDGPRGFFTIYRNLFEYLEDFEGEVEPLNRHRHTQSARQATGPVYTIFGSKNSPYEPMVKQFYDRWMHFTTGRTFDEGDRYYPTYGDNRRMRRAMHKENSKGRDALRREFSETVRDLAAFVKKRDPRWKAHQKAKAEMREREEAERRVRDKKRREEEAASFVEQDWNKVELDQLTKEYLAEFESSSDSSSSEEEEPSEEDVYEGDSEEDAEFYCAPCKKLFKNQSQWRNHAQSKKHKITLQSLGIPLADDTPESSPSLDMKKKKNKKNAKKKKISTLFDYEEDQDEEEMIHDNINTVANAEDLLSESMASVQLEETAAAPTHDNALNSNPKPKKKSRRATTNSTKTREIEVDFICNVCKELFPSRNQLFKHVHSEGHEQATTTSNTAKSKRKGR